MFAGCVRFSMTMFLREITFLTGAAFLLNIP